MLRTIGVLIIILQIFRTQAAFSQAIEVYKFGNSGSAGGGQQTGMDVSNLFKESPEVKRLQERAHEIDSITASIKNTDQRIAIKKQAITRLKDIVAKRNIVREQVKHMDHVNIRTGYVDIATNSIKESRDFYIANEPESGMIAANIAETALDLATSFTPGISWARDFYEAFSGKHLTLQRISKNNDLGI